MKRTRGTIGRLVGLVAVAALLAAAPTRGADAAAVDPSNLVYAALGDSYTSGPLIFPHDTSRVPLGCGQSQRNYPHLVARRLGVAELRDVSCGGASIDQFTVPHDVVTGINPPQFDVLGADVDVVTIGMGGNDVGFVGLAFDCVRLLPQPLSEPCTPQLAPGEPDPTQQRIAHTAIQLADALDTVAELAPNALVYVVGYPTALPDDGRGCWPYVPILDVDMPYLVARFKEMNAMLEEVAVSKGVTYIDLYTPSIGHDVCQLPTVAWVNGMVLVPLSFPAHPNGIGMRRLAPVVASAILAGETNRAD